MAECHVAGDKQRRESEIKLAPDGKPLLTAKGLPWDRKQRASTIKVSVPRTPLPVGGVHLPTEPRARGDGGQGRGPRPRQVYSRKNVEILKCGQTLGCQSCRAIATENIESISYNSECRKRMDTTQLEPNVSNNACEGKVKWRKEQAWSWSEAGV